MKLQRTGLTEGSILYNDWLKEKNLYRPDTEKEFINWLYTTSGWYDKDIKGSYFDIDYQAVINSELYWRWKTEFREALLNSDMFHLMVHGEFHLNGLEFQDEFTHQFSKESYCYWKDVQLLHTLTDGKQLLIVNDLAPLITDKYWTSENKMYGYRTPQNFFNNGDEKNGFETLDKVWEELPKDFDLALVSFGAYGCLLVDRIVKSGKSAMTIGSGLFDLFPIDNIPAEFKPKDYRKIEDGRYWNS